MDRRITRIKFCGITNFEDAIYASNLGVNAIGFIFSESKRKVQPEMAKKIIKALPPFVLSVGVFMNETLNKIVETAKYTGIDIIQLHGTEPSRTCKTIKVLTGKKIIKRIKISSFMDEKEISENIESYSEFHPLFDPGAGSGKTFNWEILKGIDIPFTVAGGLTPENVGKLIKTLKPYAVDVSSGIEKMIGKKDFHKMVKFIKEVRG